jgi:hypothetical protein
MLAASETGKGRPVVSPGFIAIISAVIICIALLTIWLFNIMLVGRPLQVAMLRDNRNAGVRASAHFQHFLNPAVLVFDLKGISGSNSRLDVLRVFLLFAEQEKSRAFSAVQLECQGHARYVLKGAYFRQLGREYQGQNPVYTIRTLAEHVYTTDGRVAYVPSNGGLMGMIDELKHFTDFMDKWCFRDLATQMSGIK